jgi:hypothetical protein
MEEAWYRLRSLFWLLADQYCANISLTVEDAMKGYYAEVASIVVHHLLPYSYSEGCCGDTEKQMKSALRTKHRITRDVMIGGVEDLRQAGCHLEVVQWAVRFGVVYTRDCSATHPEWLALCNTWDSWQQGAAAASPATSC